jgi:hypothetical protein
VRCHPVPLIEEDLNLIVSCRMLQQKASEMKKKLDDSIGKRVFNATEDQKEIKQAVEEVRFAIEVAMVCPSRSAPQCSF